MYTNSQSDLDNEHKPVPTTTQSKDDTNLQALAKANSTLSSTDVPTYPGWPTSHPGPLANEPGKDERSVNPQRREQMLILRNNSEEYNANG